MYELIIDRDAEKDLKKIPVSYFQQIASQINALSQNPRPQGCKKISGSKSDWRIRIGKYRVIYEIDDTASMVRVMRVRHRREAYR